MSGKKPGLLEREEGTHRPKPPCGGRSCGYTTHDGQRIESHVLDVGEACPQHTTARETCTLHGGVHYRHPILHGVLWDLLDPALAGA